MIPNEQYLRAIFDSVHGNTDTWNKIRDKFISGGLEHKSDIRLQPCLDHSLEEAYDLVNYLATHKQQIDRVCEYLETALMLSKMTEPARWNIRAALNVLRYGSATPPEDVTNNKETK